VIGPTDARERVDETAERLREAGVEADATVAEGDVLETIVEHSSGHDLTVIGSTCEGILQQFVFGAIPEEVAREADDTVLVAKRNEGLSSRAFHSLRRRLR
jgi:nucleotide-binding universal stress UspA family protein